MTTIDAAVMWYNGKAYMFGGAHYVRYDVAGDLADDRYPREIDRHTWPGLEWDGDIDAALDWGNNKVYFFRGSYYIRYDVMANAADPGYPRKINDQTWPGLRWTDIGAAVNWDNRIAYFFKGSHYVRYDIARDQAIEGYPQPINEKTWPKLGLTRVDSAVNWGNNKVYCFSGSKYTRYDVVANEADPGYPREIGPAWPGLASRVGTKGTTWVSIRNTRHGVIEFDGGDTAGARPNDWIGLYEFAPFAQTFPIDPNTQWTTWQWAAKSPYVTDIPYRAGIWGAAYVRERRGGGWEYEAQVLT